VAAEPRIEVLSENAHVCIVLTGEIDGQASQAVVEQGLQALREHPAELVLDLSGVTFLDSGGISAIVALRNQTIGTATRLRLRPGPPNVMRVLHIVGLDTAIELLDS